MIKGNERERGIEKERDVLCKKKQKNERKIKQTNEGDEYEIVSQNCSCSGVSATEFVS